MNRNLKKAVAAATISGALGFSAVAMGAGVANADDDHGPWVPWVPWQPGQVWQNCGALGSVVPREVDTTALARR
jgi:hypothetical protein